LAGRAFTYTLFPFSTYELKDLFDLNNVLEFGALPKLLEFNEHEDKLDFLRSYCQTYLREEIQIEQIVRNLNPFRDFLEMAAQLNGKIINYSKMARQIAIDDKTIHNYFQILEDTLIGFFLPPFNRSIRKRQRESPKFYFIDPGIKRALDQSLRVKLLPQTYAYGDAFEHWVILECVKLNQYLKLDYKLSYLRTKDNAEIDLVIQRPAQGDLLIEIKSSQQVDQTDVLSLTRFSKSWDKENKAILLSNDPHSKNFEDVTAYHWKSGLEKIFFEFDPLPNTP
jgi:predicted AAA+ superfamily ATPase